MVSLALRNCPRSATAHVGLNKPKQGHLKRNGMNLPDLRYLREFRTKDVDVAEGQRLTADVFSQGDRIDVVGTSKDAAPPVRSSATTSTARRRRMVSRTASARPLDRCDLDPGRVLKGTRMAGRMGNERVTVQNLEVVVVDAEKNLLAVRGSVPGSKGGIC